MKQGSNYIFFSLLGLLLGGGLLLFLFHVQLFNFLEGNLDLGDPAVSSAPRAASGTPSWDVLQNPRLASLTNYVVNFDFDNICWRPDAAKIQTVLSPENTVTPAETATDTVMETALNCRLGNALPFVDKKK